MKQLRWPTNKDQHEYMQGRADQNKARSQTNSNEQWVKDILGNTPYKWTPQAQWGYRIYDFWCAELGVAVETDGPEHNKNYDAYRDEYNFRRSAIVVLRLKNRDAEGMARVLAILPLLGNWKDRRTELGLDRHTKRERRELVNLPDSRHCLEEYLLRLGA